MLKNNFCKSIIPFIRKENTLWKQMLMICAFFVFISQHSFAQLDNNLRPSLSKISLNDILSQANKNSLDAYKAKRKYGVNYWEFKSFKSSLFPKINFEAKPLTYNRSVIKRYDSEQNIDVYRSQQNLNSYANISINQNIRETGTSLFIYSNLNRLANFGDIDIENYNATPFSIGLFQPLMAFNTFKWEHKIAPVKYKQAQQNFIFDLQAINLKAVGLFFNWALANKKLEIAKENKISAEKLFKIGQKRYDIGSIEKDDVLNLELDVYNAKTSVTQNEQALEKAESELKLFLRYDKPFNKTPELPELISDLQIDVKKAIDLTKANNPNNLGLRLKKLEAQRDLDKAIKENRFDLSLTASYGLNQQANRFNDVYSNFLEQEMVAIQFSVPILDWGERKGKIKTAKMNKQVVDIELQQDEEFYKQDITLKVIDFNLQKELVNGALRTSEISKESYELTKKRFLSGRIDLLKLASARKAWQSSSENYIKSLQNYWTLYYQVQQLTLYDFLNKKELTEDFSVILE